jgi:hypothetical protein
LNDKYGHPDQGGDRDGHADQEKLAHLMLLYRPPGLSPTTSGAGRVVLGKGFRASTGRAPELGEIGFSGLAMKADKRERRRTSRANRLVAGQ